MSASESMTASKLSVHLHAGGTQSTFLRSTPRLQIAVSCSDGWMPLDSTLATERPTVPKPTIATFSGRGSRRAPAWRALHSLLSRLLRLPSALAPI